MVVKKLSCTNCTFRRMNYLAHAHLSFNQPHILVGNMVSDFVKGRKKYLYAASIQKGMELHRAIDTFTDEHPATAKAKAFFRPHYRLYSAPIMDIVYDHFLANDQNEFTGEELHSFTNRVYSTLEEEAAHLPSNFLPVLTYMKADNWLYHYRTTDGIQKSLRGLARRAIYMKESAVAFDIFLQNYVEIEQCYQDFFPDVKQMAKQKLAALLA